MPHPAEHTANTLCSCAIPRRNPALKGGTPAQGTGWSRKQRWAHGCGPVPGCGGCHGWRASSHSWRTWRTGWDGNAQGTRGGSSSRASGMGHGVRAVARRGGLWPPGAACWQLRAHSHGSHCWGGNWTGWWGKRWTSHWYIACEIGRRSWTSPIETKPVTGEKEKKKKQQFRICRKRVKKIKWAREVLALLMTLQQYFCSSHTLFFSTVVE